MAKFEGKLSVTPYFLHHYLDNNGAGMHLKDKLSSKTCILLSYFNLKRNYNYAIHMKKDKKYQV